MIEAGGRTVGGEACPRRFRSLQVLQLDLDQIGQLQIVEEKIEELFLGQREGELVLSLAVRAAAAATATTAALRLRDLVADLILLVARQHVVVHAAIAAEAEGGLAQALGADGDLLRAFGLRHLARLERVLDGLADLGLGPAQEPLAIAEALGFRIEPPIDDLHHAIRYQVSRDRSQCRTPQQAAPAAARAQDVTRRRLARTRSISSTSSPACTIRPAAAPAGGCTRARPCAARTPRASSRSRCPASCRS